MLIKARRRLLAWLLGGAFAPAVHGAPAAGKLAIGGSRTLVPLVAEIAKRFESSHPGVQVTVSAVGAGKGMNDLSASALDIAVLARPLFGAERTLHEFPIARDGAALIVHRDNPVDDISLARLESLIVGRVENWQELGGRNAPIELLWPAEGASIVALLLAHFHLTTAGVRPARRNLVSSEAIIQAVLASPDAVAPMSLGVGERAARAGIAVKLLRLDGVDASSSMVLRNQYPLVRPLSLVTTKLPDGPARSFIEYAMSPAVKDLVRKFDFVPYSD